MPDVKRFSLVKPTLQTRFRIDFDWWVQNERDWHVYLRSYLCPEHQESFVNMNNDDLVDWIDPETAEVTQVDGLQHVLITHCAKTTDFITGRTALVDAIFRTFLANGNEPLSSRDLETRLGRPAATILRTIGGLRIYDGIKPVQGDKG